jgi:hypothetical protein
LIAVKFPGERVLDPVGWNRRNGFNETYGLKETGLQLRFRAQTIPWHKTGIDEIIKSNLKRLQQEKIKPRQEIPKQDDQQRKRGQKM